MFVQFASLLMIRAAAVCCLAQVKAAAAAAGTATFKLVGNRDIEHILDDLLHCVARPAEVPDVVSKLSATTFVQVGAGPGTQCCRLSILAQQHLHLEKLHFFCSSQCHVGCVQHTLIDVPRCAYVGS